MRRRLRKRTTENNQPQPPSWLSRVPTGLIWTILALVVLVMVLSYDRREQHEAKEHIANAQQWVKEEHYGQAIAEYKKALENKRLNNKAKGEVALALGNLYYDHFENYDEAYSYYVRAKRLAPKVVRDAATQERIKIAQERKTGRTVIGDEGTTQTVIDRVELIRQPATDLHGPVIARIKGQEIHAGELQRTLQSQPNWQETVLKANDVKLAELVQDYLNRSLLYRAAIDEGFQRNPDVTQKLFDYQKTLISERYLSDAREKALQVSDKEVADYYQKHLSTYCQPARISLAMIKTDTAEKAQKVLEKLRDGAVFGDVATSESIDKASARTHGTVGTISEKDPFVPGIGRIPEVLGELLKMEPPQITGVTQIGNAYYIFKILNKIPRSERTMEELRPEIEQLVRAEKSNSVTSGLYGNLSKQYNAQIDREGLSHFWEFAGRSLHANDESSSASEENTSAPVATKKASSTTSAPEQTKAEAQR